MSSKKSEDKYGKLLNKLMKDTKQDEITKTIEKIKEALMNTQEIKKDWSQLFKIIDRLTEDSLRIKIGMMQFLLENSIIEEKYKKEYRNKLVNAVIEYQGDDNFKADCIKKQFLQIEIIELFKDNTLINAVMFNCFPKYSDDSFLASIYSFLTQTQSKSIFLLDFITESMITIGLTHTGQLNTLYSLFKIFDYYMNEIRCHIPLKKIIIGILCLEYSIEKRNDIDIIWMTIKKVMINNPIGIFKLLIDILAHYFPSNCLSSFMEFTRYNSYINIETNQKPKDNKLYITYLTSIKNQVPKDFFEVNKVAIQEGAFLLIEKILCELTKSIDTILSHFPFVIIFNKLTMFPFSEQKILTRAYLHLTLTLINKYGDRMTEIIPDLMESFDVIVNINNLDTNSDKEMSELIKEFYNTLFQLIVSKKLSLALLMHQTRVGTALKKNKLITESFLFLYTFYFLGQNFDSNCEKIFDQYVLKYNYPRFQSYYLDVLMYNLRSNKKRADIIEKLIFKSQVKSFKAFLNEASVRGRFIALLTDVMTRTADMTSFVKGYNLLLESNEYVIEVQKKALIMLMDKLNKRQIQSKLKICDVILFNKDIFFNSYSQSIILSLLNTMIINRNFEVFFSDTKNVNDKGYTRSQIKLIDINEKEKTDNADDDYYIFDFVKIVNYLIEHLKTIDIINNDKQAEKIYETLSLFAQKCFLFRKANISLLIVILTKHLEEALKTNNNRLISLILDILISIVYHLKHNLTPEASNENDKPSFLLVNEPKIKENIIAILAKVYIDLVNSIKKDSREINVISRCKSHKESPANQLKTPNISSFSNNNSSQISNNQRNSKESPPQPNTLINEDLGLDAESKAKLKLITQILQTLQLYFNSITYYNHPNQQQQDESIKYKSNYFLNTNLTKNKYGSQFLQTTIKKLLRAISDSIWILAYKPKYIISLLHFIFGIRELLFKYQDKIILRIIIIAIAIGWSQENNSIVSQIEYVFNLAETKRIKCELTVDFISKSNSKKLQYEYIKYLSDTIVLYFMEKLKPCALLFKIIQEKLTRSTQPLRKNIFTELIKWHLLSNKNRDNNIALKKNSNISIENCLMFLGEDTIIMLVPVTISKSDLIIRNIISNANISICSNTEHITQSQAIDSLKKLINNEMPIANIKEDSIPCTNIKEGIDKPVLDTNDCSKDTNVLNDQNKIKAMNTAITTIQQIMHYTCDSFDKFFYIENNHNINLNEQLSQLDKIPVNSTYICGVIFAKGSSLKDEYELLTYQGEVNEEYINFLNCLGILYNLEDNPQLNLSLFNTKSINYIICNQDSFSCLLFQVSNLIGKNESDSDIVYQSRKSLFEENYVNIIWMDNPTKTFNPAIINRKTTDPYLYIVVSPIAFCHYSIKTIWYSNDDLKKKCIEGIKSLFLSDFVLNVNERSSIMFFIQHIIQINGVKEYLLLDIKLRENKLINIMNDILKQGLRNNYVDRAIKINDIIYELRSKS